MDNPNATRVYWHGLLQYIVMGEVGNAYAVAVTLIKDTKYDIAEFEFVRCYIKP